MFRFAYYSDTQVVPSIAGNAWLQAQGNVWNWGTIPGENRKHLALDRSWNKRIPP